MATDPRLESYLASLDRVLQPFPASDRAEIVLEIKSHVLAALERSPEGGIDPVLRALGAPETVANRCLIERGMKPMKPPISPAVKWVVIGILGLAALGVLLAAVAMWKISPLILINGREDRVTLMGGAIDIDGKRDSVKIGGIQIDGDEWKGGWHRGWDTGRGKDLIGSRALKEGETVVLSFEQGNIKITDASGSEVSWECRVPNAFDLPTPPAGAGRFELAMTSAVGVECELGIPKGRRLEIRGRRGKVEIARPHFHVQADLDMGKIGIDPDSDQRYRYALDVKTDAQDSFSVEEGGKPGDPAYEITARVRMGKIERNDSF